MFDPGQSADIEESKDDSMYQSNSSFMGVSDPLQISASDAGFSKDEISITYNKEMSLEVLAD